MKIYIHRTERNACRTRCIVHLLENIGLTRLTRVGGEERIEREAHLRDSLSLSLSISLWLDQHLAGYG